MSSANVSQAVRGCALSALSVGQLPHDGLPSGIKAVALWRHARCGSVLFFAEPTAGLFPFDYPSLYHEDAHLLPVFRHWRSTGGGGIGLDSELIAGSSGLHQLGSALNSQVRLVFGHASSDVARIRLANQQRAWDVPVGVDGFFLLGVASGESKTSAVAIGSDNNVIPGTPLPL